jgi:hypothetical protein
MGVAKAFLELSNKQILKDKCVYSGISGGSGTAGFLYASLHSIGNMDFWFDHFRHIMNWLSNSYIKSYYITDLLWQSGKKYFHICKSNGLHFNNRYHIYTSKLVQNKIISQTFSNFDDHEETLPNALVASSFIPYLVGSGSCLKINDSYYLDGGFIKINQHVKKAKKRIYFSLTDTFDKSRIDENNDIIIGIIDNRLPFMKYNFYTSFFYLHYKLVTSQDFSKELYDKGYMYGMENLPKINLLKELLN